ncbi:hypothetical protein Slin15195_G039610 [Septoria linicola]|uniref:Uncharacterized protein n=1 Tax=Septoria linicola TaxID=215465 RepID=A0A9Q9EI47_9PEZI|nr:hypothetical protein Slin15195_G039610 [Septoria linicola]
MFGRSPKSVVAIAYDKIFAPTRTATCKPWTEAEMGKLVSLVAQKRTSKFIADALGQTHSSVQHRIAALNSDNQQLRDRTNPKPRSERGWSPQEIARLHEMRSNGMKIEAIGLELERSKNNEKLLKLKASGKTWAQIQAEMPQRAAHAWKARFYKLRHRPDQGKSHRPRSKEDVYKLHLLHAENLATKDIARALDRSPGAIISALRNRYPPAPL